MRDNQHRKANAFFAKLLHYNGPTITPIRYGEFFHRNLIKNFRNLCLREAAELVTRGFQIVMFFDRGIIGAVIRDSDLMKFALTTSGGHKQFFMNDYVMLLDLIPSPISLSAYMVSRQSKPMRLGPMEI